MCTTGGLAAVVAVVDPEVSGQADLGGMIDLRPPVTGSGRHAACTLADLGPDSGTDPFFLPTGRNPSVVALCDDGVVVVLTLVIRDGLVHHLDVLVDPWS